MAEPSVTLRFETEEARNYFMGQLSDGWGENGCYLEWDGDFESAAEFKVVPVDPEGEPVGSPIWGEE